MNEEDAQIVVPRTTIIRHPRQTLATFGSTTINYYMLTQPAYSGTDAEETIVRSGRVIANRPKLVTPYYLSRLDGFSSEARAHFNRLISEYGAQATSIYYTYRNEHFNTEIASCSMSEIVVKTNAEIDEKGDHLAAIIGGDDTSWDLSLLEFIFKMTLASVGSNISEMRKRGLLKNGAVLHQARAGIEEMFEALSRKNIEPKELQAELDRWGLFEEYQDRFFALFRKR